MGQFYFEQLLGTAPRTLSRRPDPTFHVKEGQLQGRVKVPEG